MKKTHCIEWQSTVNGRRGTGTLLFDEATAVQLAAELNRDYPEINHQAVRSANAPSSRPEAVVVKIENDLAQGIPQGLPA